MALERTMRLHIGLDLDNTIIDYEGVFGPAAEEIGLLPTGHGLLNKEAVKARLIATDPSEAQWMRLQGQVYGRFIGGAVPYPGVIEFLTAMRRAGARVSIVSHKTEYGHFDEARVHLWQAALGWLESHGFFTSSHFAIERTDVHFATTRDAKIMQIQALGCRAFVDDLPEVLAHPDFPADVEKIWFAPAQVDRDVTGFYPHRDWGSIMDSVLNRH